MHTETGKIRGGGMGCDKFCHEFTLDRLNGRNVDEVSNLFCARFPSPPDHKERGEKGVPKKRFYLVFLCAV